LGHGCGWSWRTSWGKCVGLCIVELIGCESNRFRDYGKIWDEVEDRVAGKGLELSKNRVG